MKYLLSFLLSISCSFLFAQKITDKAVKQCCDCLVKIDMNLDGKTLEDKATKCIEDAIMTNLSGLIKEYNLDLNDDAASEKIGEKIGMKLVAKCPVFVEMALKFPDEESDEEQSDNYEFAEGKVTAVKKSEYITLTLTETSGDIRIFYLIDYFNGAEKITADLNTMQNKKVKVGFVAKKIFDNESNDFKERKVLVAFEYWN